jgi:hypothetical protein
VPVAAGGLGIDRRQQGDGTERDGGHRTELVDEHLSISTGHILMITASPLR